MSFFYIDIRFPSSVNKGYSVDTWFCTHDLIKENDFKDQSMYPKNHNCITCIKSWLHYIHQFVLALTTSTCLCITFINSIIAYHKNDLEILTVATEFLVFKSNHQIERYPMIKFARSTCIVSRWNWPHVINLN